MAKFIKIVVGIVVGLVLLVVVAMAGVLIFVDPNDYKDDITAAVKQATGRELTLAGDLSLSVFPWLGLSLGEAQLSNAPGFGDVPFARVQAVDIKVKLLPLLQQRVEMKTVRLAGLEVSLAKAKDGRTNWEDLMGQPAAATEAAVEPAEKAPVPKPTATTGAPALAALAIGGIEIDNAKAVWDDRSTGQQARVEQLNLQTGPLTLTDPIDIKLSMNVALKEPAIQTPIQFSGRVGFDLAKARYRIDGMTLAVNAKSDLLPVSPLAVKLSGDVSTDMGSQQAEVKNFTVSTLGMNIGANLQVEKMLDAPEAQGTLRISEFSPRELLKTLHISLPDMADAHVLSKAQLNASLKASMVDAAIDNLKILVDDTEITGKLSVANFTKPAIRYDLAINAVDVDRYLPPPSAKAEVVAPPTPATAAAGATQLPLEMLRDLDVDGQLKLGQLKAVNAKVANIQVGLNAKGGLLRLYPLEAQLYGGGYSGDAALDVKTDTPKLSLNEKLTNVNVGPLLKDMLDKELVSGVADISAAVTANGVAPEKIMKTLNGTAQFSFKDGAVTGVNFGQMIREAYAKIKKQPPPPKTTNSTDFAAMSGSVKVVNGVVRNDDLDVKSPLLRIGGKGSVDLPKQKINYLVNAALVETAEGQGGKGMEELKSVLIPIKVTGTFSEPKFSLDLAPIIKGKVDAELAKQKAAIKEQVDKKVAEEKAKVNQKIEDEKAKAKQKIEDEKAKAKKKLEEELKKKLKGL